MLELEKITKLYGPHAALRNVSLSVRPGECVALLGANGAGKTTTIRAICKLLEIDGGDIRFGGETIRRRKDYLARIGAVLEGRQNLNWRLSVEQNAYYFAGIRGLAPAQVEGNVQRLRDQLGLTQYGDRIVAQLSSGNRQKAALSCVLCYEPELVMLDEPTLGLDLVTVDELASIIVRQSEEFGRSFIITSHDMRFIDRVCSRVIVLREGEVVFDSPKSQISSHLHQYELRATLSSDELDRLRSHSDASLFGHGELTFGEGDGTLLMKYNEPSHGLPFMAWLHQSGIVPRNLEIRPVSIETAYKSLLT
jgi:ABC-2 type transport system ATP-binding protein